jgi:hypothetical protein
MADLTTNAVVARFSLGQWSGKIRDQEAGEELAQNKGAKKAPTVIKPLAINNELDALAKKITECRTWHYKHTYPFRFGDKRDPILDKGTGNKKLVGVALVPIMIFEDYCRKMQNFRLEIEAMEKHIVDNYDELIEAARQAQNGLFKVDDYPSKEELESRYHFDLEFEPVPPEHFQNQIICEALKEAEQKHQVKVMQAKAMVLQESFARLHKVVNHAFEALADPTKKFHDTLIGNITEIVRILPKMNILEDPMLDALVKEAEQNLTQHLPDMLRDNPTVRKEVSDKAKDILDKMAGYIGTPEPVPPEPPVIEASPDGPNVRHQPFKRDKGDYTLDVILGD